MDQLIWRLVAAGVACPLAVLALHVAPLFGIGPWSFDMSPLVLALANLLIAVFALIACGYALWHRRFLLALVGVVLTLSTFLLWGPAIVWGERARIFAFAVVAQRAQPLVAAMHEHHRQYGRPPATVDHLVPQFIDKIPFGLPPLEVQLRGECPAGSWALRAWVESGPFSTDRFIYLDTRDYWGCSQHKQPRFERVGDWLYVHAMD